MFKKRFSLLRVRYSNSLVNLKQALNMSIQKWNSNTQNLRDAQANKYLRGCGCGEGKTKKVDGPLELSMVHVDYPELANEMGKPLVVDLDAEAIRIYAE